MPEGAGAEREPAGLPPISGASWLERNLAPLLVIFAAMLLAAVSVAMADVFVAMLTKLGVDRLAEAEPQAAAMGDLAQRLEHSRFAFFVISGTALGMLACVGAALAWLVSRSAREYLNRLLSAWPKRPLPALRMMDFIAVFAVYISVNQFLAITIAPALRDCGTGAVRAILFLLNGASLCAAVATGVFLARHRAGAPHGSCGVWPFWTLSPGNPARSMWRDAGLGALCYPLTFWMAAYAVKLNQFVLDALKIERSEHALVQELLKQPTGWTLFVFLFMATVGAAFFEELVFRGMLYNALRRCMNGLWAAVAAAAIFAAVHLSGTHSRGQMLGLFVLALILIWLYERTGRLIASMTFHALNNLVSLLMVLFIDK